MLSWLYFAGKVACRREAWTHTRRCRYEETISFAAPFFESLGPPSRRALRPNVRLRSSLASQTSFSFPVRSMASAQQQWPDRRNEILGTTISVGILSTIVLIWRVVYAVQNKRKLLFCDYLLILAGVRSKPSKRRDSADETGVERNDDGSSFSDHRLCSRSTYR